MYETKPYFYGTGRRKHSVARVRVYNGTGKMTINGRDINDYFGLETLKLLANSPLVLTENEGKFDVVVNVVGGGCAGQAGAIRHGLSRALLQFNPELRPALKKAGFLTRDPRMKERKKYGGLDLADKALDPLLELTTELGARNEGGHIQQEDLLVPQAGGHLALSNALGDALGDGSLADTGLTDQAGVVLLAAAQDLDGAVNFAVAADDAVHLAVPGLLGQVLTVGIQELALGGFVLFTVFAFGLVVAALAGCTKAKREHRRTAGHKIVLTVALLGGVLTCCGGQHTGLGSLLQEAAHAFFHVLQILIGHAELFHQIIHGLDVHLAGAGQAVALLHRLAVVHPLDEHHGRAFFAAYTNHNFFTSIENARYRRIVLQIL